MVASEARSSIQNLVGDARLGACRERLLVSSLVRLGNGFANSFAYNANVIPAIVALDAHYHRVRELGSWLGGSAFADERGWLEPDERDRFAREQHLFPWTAGDLEAHKDRVLLDHPKEFRAWEKERGLKRRQLPRWRLERVDHPPRGDLFEMELHVTWRITKVESGALVLEVQGCEELEYDGRGWAPTGTKTAARVRIDHNDAHVLHADGSESRIPLT